MLRIPTAWTSKVSEDCHLLIWATNTQHHKMANKNTQIEATKAYFSPFQNCCVSPTCASTSPSSTLWETTCWIGASTCCRNIITPSTSWLSEEAASVTATPQSVPRCQGSTPERMAWWAQGLDQATSQKNIYCTVCNTVGINKNRSCLFTSDHVNSSKVYMLMSLLFSDWSDPRPVWMQT